MLITHITPHATVTDQHRLSEPIDRNIPEFARLNRTRLIANLLQIYFFSSVFSFSPPLPDLFGKCHWIFIDVLACTMHVHEYARSCVFPSPTIFQQPALKNRYLTLAATSKSTFPFVFKSEISKEREIRILATFGSVNSIERLKESKWLKPRLTSKFLRIILSNFQKLTTNARHSFKFHLLRVIILW